MTIPNSSASTSYAPRKITIGVLALQGAFIEHIHYLQSLSIPSTTIHAIPIRTAAELELCDALVIPGGESTVIQSVAERTAGLLPLLQEFVRDPNRPVWGTCAGMILMAEEDGIGGGKVIKGRSPPKGWGGIDGLRVWRNLYGTQLESFEAHMQIPALADPEKAFNCIFIRAPAVHSLRPSPSPSPKLPNGHGLTNGTNGSTSRGLGDTEGSVVGETYLPVSGETVLKAYTPVEVLVTLPAECTAPPPPSDTPLGPSTLEDLGKVMIRQGRKLVTSFHPELSGDNRVHRYWVEKCVLGL